MATYSKLNTGKPTAIDFASVKDITDRIDNNEAALAGDSSLDNIVITGGSIANVSAVITGGSIAGVTAAVTSLSCSGDASVAGNLSVTGNSTINGHQTVEGISTHNGDVVNQRLTRCLKGINYESSISSQVYLRQTRVDIGAWNMQGSATKTIEIPAAAGYRICAVNFVIYSDAGDITGVVPSGSLYTTVAASLSWYVSSSNLYMRRRDSSYFDSSIYSSGTLNRGYVLITSEHRP